MEERIIIKGAFNKKNTLTIAFVILAIISLIISVQIDSPGPNYTLHEYLNTAICFDCPEGVGVLFYLSFLFIATAVFFWFQMSYCQLTVTNKRVYGKTAFGKAMDLPLDEISSLGTCFPSGVFAATSSGIVRFWLLSNKSDVYNSISNLLKERQTEKNSNIHNSNADELKKYKDLLDSGVISQEEFDAKKKQLLGL